MSEKDPGAANVEARLSPSMSDVVSKADFVEEHVRLEETLRPELRLSRWDQLDDNEGEGTRYWFDQEMEVIVELSKGVSVSELVEGGYSPKVAQALTDRIADFRDALPFAEGERRWLVDAFEEARLEAEAEKRATGQHYSSDTVVDKVADMSADIVSAGQHQTVSGQELIERLWNWRRQTGAYEPGSGGVDAALVAVKGILAFFKVDEAIEDVVLISEAELAANEQK